MMHTVLLHCPINAEIKTADSQLDLRILVLNFMINHAPFPFRWIAGVALTCFLLLIVVLMALGLMCGVCGHDKEATPTVRGTVSNMGGLSLMA